MKKKRIPSRIKSTNFIFRKEFSLNHLAYARIKITIKRTQNKSKKKLRKKNAIRIIKNENFKLHLIKLTFFGERRASEKFLYSSINYYFTLRVSS